jgi:hypothetical protein
MLLNKLDHITEKYGTGLGMKQTYDAALAVGYLWTQPLKALLRTQRDPAVDKHIKALQGAASSMRDMEMRAPVDALQNMPVEQQKQ